MMSHLTKQPSSRSRRSDLPKLFLYMELGEWDKAEERLRRHPREAKDWATLRTRSSTMNSSSATAAAAAASNSATMKKGTRRLALHHACIKLRSAGASPPPPRPQKDQFEEVCRFILFILRLHPDAARERETAHGCLPLHLAAFASCAPRSPEELNEKLSSHSTISSHGRQHSSQSHVRTPSAGSASAGIMSGAATTPTTPMQRPTSIMNRRVQSDSTSVLQPSTGGEDMTIMHEAERLTGEAGERVLDEEEQQHVVTTSHHVVGGGGSNRAITSGTNPNDLSVSMASSHVYISSKREEMAVAVINALLDAYPKAIRLDSEGGRLPLHTACAGRATPRVISTLIRQDPSAARHRNKDAFLPLHLAAHWGVSHPNVAITLLKAYPDATVGRNRWERTPLEEALVMAGENGRPHQAALVRALRKHPSFWSQPIEALLAKPESQRRYTTGPSMVDVDESLPSNDSTTELEAERRYFNYGLGDPILNVPSDTSSGRMSSPYSPHDDQQSSLAQLIGQRRWPAVVARLDSNPLEAEEELHVMTRGGFLASNGFMALHYACERSPPVEVVHRLIEANSVAVLTRMMPGGCVPLHIACTWQASPEVVIALLTADQGAANMADELGNVPLHSACFSGAPVDIVEALLAVDCNVTWNKQGSKPVDIVKRLRHENRREVLRLLSQQSDLVHRRSRSSGTWSDAAREAAELNAGGGPGTPGRAGHARAAQSYDREGDLDDLQEQAIEVSYEGHNNNNNNNNNDGSELLWI